MDVQEQIETWIAEQPERKREDIQALHRRIAAMSPDGRLWFVSGRNEAGKAVANPSVGYGTYINRTADGRASEVYRVGLSATASGISVYLLGIKDRMYLPQTFGGRLGKAKVTGYCISFRSLKDVNLPLLAEAIAQHLTGGSTVD